MAETLLLKAAVREVTGTVHASKVRKEGRVPAVMYGHKKEPAAISLDEHNLVEGLRHGHRIFEVKIGKRKETVIVKDIQYDHLGKRIIHVDLMRVNVTERVTVAVPIELKGTAKGTHEGGIVEERADRLEIECKANDIPERVVVSVKEMRVGETLHAGDIELPAGAKLVSDPTMVVASCSLVAAAKTTEEIEEEEPAAPEVIGEKKEAEEASPEEEKG